MGVVLACLALAGSLAVGCNRRTSPYRADEPPPDPTPVRIPMLAAPQPSVGSRATPGPMGQAAAGAPASDPGQPASSPTASAEAVRGTIRLAPGVPVPERGVLFLFARSSAGPGMPLAAKRIAPQAFPIEFTLGPEDKMGGMPQPFAGPMTVLARIDTDGNASTTMPGDLAGAAAGSVMPGDTGLEIVLGPADR